MSYAIYSDLTQQWVDHRDNPRILGGGGKRATMQSLGFPVVYEPGTGWSYSPGLNWAGVLIERVTGQDLERIFSENIFKPVGMTSTSLFPNETVQSRLMAMTKGIEDGKIEISRTISNLTTCPERAIRQRLAPCSRAALVCTERQKTFSRCFVPFSPVASLANLDPRRRYSRKQVTMKCSKTSALRNRHQTTLTRANKDYCGSWNPPVIIIPTYSRINLGQTSDTRLDYA